MAEDIFKFRDRDLVNLQKWMRNRPIEFGRAVSSVINTLVFRTRRGAIQNLEDQTTTRSAAFLRASIRVSKSRPRTNLAQIVGEVGSIDVSKAGRSSGFEELEEGSRSRSDRVPTLQARTGGNASKKVKKAVRFNKISNFHRHTKFAGKNKRAKIAAMLRAIRSGDADKKPFIIPRGSGLGMTAGIYEKKGKRLNLVNPFDGVRGKTKKIAWMRRAAAKAASVSNLKKIWVEEADKRFKLRKT